MLYMGGYIPQSRKNRSCHDPFMSKVSALPSLPISSYIVSHHLPIEQFSEDTSPILSYPLKASKLATSSSRTACVENPSTPNRAPIPSNHYIPESQSTTMSSSTTHDELFDAGMKIRKEVAGEAYVSRALQGGQSEFAYPQQQLITE